jgi:hypothetical protein
VLRFLDQPEIKAQYHRVEKDSKNFGRVVVHFLRYHRHPSPSQLSRSTQLRPPSYPQARPGSYRAETARAAPHVGPLCGRLQCPQGVPLAGSRSPMNGSSRTHGTDPLEARPVVLPLTEADSPPIR